MALTAAYLVDEVIPEAPVRQWVLSFPIPLRLMCRAARTTDFRTGDRRLGDCAMSETTGGSRQPPSSSVLAIFRSYLRSSDEPRYITKSPLRPTTREFTKALLITMPCA
jgi:hypothetical protein